MIHLETSRLILREHSEGDLEDMYRLFSDPEVMQYVQAEPHPDINTTSARLTQIRCDQKSTTRKNYFFAVIDKESLQYAGDAGFTVFETQSGEYVADLGYFFHKHFWGQGYVSEACKEIIRYAFVYLHVHKVIANCQKENIASEKVMIRSGMHKEAERRNCRFKHGKWLSEVQYSIGVEDYSGE